MENLQSVTREEERREAEQGPSRRLIWIDDFMAASRVMNDVCRVPPEAVDGEPVFLQHRAHLIEASGFVVLGRLVKVSVGAEEKNEEPAFCATPA